MNETTHTVDSAYKQFYVADGGLNPEPPVDWTDIHVRQHFNALEHIVALCPDGDVSARIVCVPPGSAHASNQAPDFEVRTQITISSGQLSVIGWPDARLEVYTVEPGTYTIRFTGYETHRIKEEADYYVVEFELAKPKDVAGQPSGAGGRRGAAKRRRGRFGPSSNVPKPPVALLWRPALLALVGWAYILFSLHRLKLQNDAGIVVETDYTFLALNGVLSLVVLIFFVIAMRQIWSCAYRPLSYGIPMAIAISYIGTVVDVTIGVLS